MNEEGYIIMVTVRYYNSEGVELGSVNVNNGERTYRYESMCSTDHRQGNACIWCFDHSSKETVPS